MSAPPPRVSVMMAVYNSERYLAQAVESVLKQTLRELELIIIDDGSTDGSLAILQQYAAQDPRVRLSHRENRGIPQTRNELLHLATAELLAVMDSDDVALPDRLEQQVTFLQAHPEVVCLGSAFELIDAQNRRITSLPVPLEDAEIQPQILAGHAAIFQPCAMMRRDAVQQVGGYSLAMTQAEDLDLWLRLGEIGKLANLPESLVKYRLHANSVSEQDCALQRQKALEACQQAWQRRGLAGKFEATDAWRPGADRDSQHRFAMQYGWWAFNSGERQTALVYALKAIRLCPSHMGGWKLLRCGLSKAII
ncbi:MAG: glycosyltransferase [Pegethrix bostrychoides GSE-TBD4-15B]|uniref:Glycosyltransferase n=1 Tax=Pegethrix bostrychoides GSE-TBD4-15B TaxID=2839662 RepID=A0A951PDM9_9CYAN|nr:glycosyltransferase [Pegethrix bostrychoides GSE-TBD4-15B]